MSLVLDVRVYGLPASQGRPHVRVVQAKNGRVFPSVYLPANARDWKRTIQAQVLPHRPAALLEGPLALTLTFELPRPQSLPRRVVHHTRKPDVSNMLKAVEDALKGIIYRDDAQLVRVDVRKVYGPAPGAHIRLEHARALTPAATPEGR